MTLRVAVVSIALSLAAVATRGQAWAAAPQTAGVAIDRIEIQGVRSLNSDAVERTLEIGVGEAPERRKVVRTAENMQSLYVSRGFERVQVRTELVKEKVAKGSAETVLRFVIDEGLPTRIASVKFVAGLMRDVRHQRFWESIEKELQGGAGLAPGDIFDQEKLNAGKRLIQETLASEEFIGANLDDVRVSEAPQPATTVSIGGKSVASAGRWVALEFRVELGDRVVFGFRGNEAVTRSRLRALIEEQRVVGFGKDYVGAIRNRIEEEYRSLGYTRVSVTQVTTEGEGRLERHVIYLITEGPRVSIESIDFEGNAAFGSEELRARLLSFAGSLVRHGIYVDRDIQRSAGLTIEWLKSRGYLFAKLVTLNRIFEASKNSYRIVVYVYEGEQTLLQRVRIEGARGIPEPEVRKILGVTEGEPLNLYAFTEGLELLKASYRERGYLEAVIESEADDSSVVKYSHENRVADISLKIEEGPVFRVNRISIEGLVKTHEKVVLRELLVKEGDVLSESGITGSEAALRKLGLFASAQIRISDDAVRPGYKDLRVVITEGTPGVIAGGVGYRSDLGLRVFGQTAYSNLWHENHTLSLNVNTNRRFDDKFCDNLYDPSKPDSVARAGQCRLEYQVELGYYWPWIFLGDTTFRPRISFEDTKYRLFDARTLLLSNGLERPLIRKYNVTGALTYSLERVKQFNVVSAVDNVDLRIGALTPSLRLDMRDNSLAPTRGVFASASLEWADKAFLSQTGSPPVGYTRFQLRTDFFVPVTRETTWYLSLRGGYERNLATPPDSVTGEDRLKYQIPLIKQFALGGAGSIRGFEEQELNVHTQAILGTLGYLNLRTQLDLPFSGPLRFGPFLDAGNLYIDNRSIGPMRYGTGAGFHYQSPVGPVNFDLGFKIAPKPGEDPYRFYFSIGVI